MPTNTMSDGTSNAGGPDPSGSAARKKIWPFILLAVVVLAAIYVVIGFFSGRMLAPGTTVAGIDIGGKSATEAENTLRNDLRDDAEKNIEIWKVKKLIKRLEAARGNGTSMISLIIRT